SHSFFSTTLPLLRIRPPPTPTLFPYTTLFRSESAANRLIHRPKAARQASTCALVASSISLPASSKRVAASETNTAGAGRTSDSRSEEHTSELQSLTNLVCRLLLEKKKKQQQQQ